MSEEIEIDGNSGVHANVGFDFQRHTCVYKFLESYDELKDQEYFIMLEHYDDIVFGFIVNGELSKVTTYQAKKASAKWTNSHLFEIIQQISNSGIMMSRDTFGKKTNYLQTQHCISNQVIQIEYECSKTKKKKNIKVNETNERVKYIDLEDDCRAMIENGTTSVVFDHNQKSNFNNLTFSFIDLGRTAKSQIEQLIGKFRVVFGNSILDHKAALETFTYHLKQVEGIFNQGGVPKFSQENKKLYSSKIKEIINTITTKNLALDFCRKRAEKICEDLSVNVLDAPSFELHFGNSLDKFKDLTQGEHQKIIKYVNSQKTMFSLFTNDVKCISHIHSQFLKDKNSTLTSVQLIAGISAAYFLILNEK
jgi:hypothetical protein